MGAGRILRHEGDVGQGGRGQLLLFKEITMEERRSLKPLRKGETWKGKVGLGPQ